MMQKRIPGNETRLMVRMPREFRHSVMAASEKFGTVSSMNGTTISFSVPGKSSFETMNAVKKSIFQRTGVEVEVEEDVVQSINDDILISEEEEIVLPNSISGVLKRLFSKKKLQHEDSQSLVKISDKHIPISNKLYNITKSGFPLAWRHGYTGRDIICAVNDTGFGNHNSLSPALSINVCDFTSNVIEKNNDHHGHGTHVSGTIANPVSDPRMVVGGAPECTIYSFKSGNGIFYTSDLIHGIDEAVKKGVHIINNSWGGTHSNFLQAAISEAYSKGVIITKSIGNQGEMSEDCYHDCILVSAYNRHNIPARFSNWVSESYKENTVAAYGVDIYSILPGNKYGFMSGTSMATPLVSAAVALLMNKYPDKSHKEIIDILFTRCISSIKKKEYGMGLLNLEKEFSK